MSLTIRAHHLKSAKALFKLPRGVIIGQLITHGYIDSPSHPFVGLVYRFKGIFERNPRIKLKIGGLDVLCSHCPKYARGDCDPDNPRRGAVKPAFLRGDYEGPLSDMETIEKYNLDTGRTYTVEELKGIAAFSVD